MSKTVRARYALELKQEAVRLVTGGQSIAAAARSLRMVEQTLFNWVKADREGELKGADSKVVSAEQMQISRLRAELARVKMERDILGKATRLHSTLAYVSPAVRARLAGHAGHAGQASQFVIRLWGTQSRGEVKKLYF